MISIIKSVFSNSIPSISVITESLNKPAIITNLPSLQNMLAGIANVEESPFMLCYKVILGH